MKILFPILLFFLSQLAHAQPSAKNIHGAVDFIVSKFDVYDIVAIGETHDKAEVTDFYISLIGQAEFREKVDVVVIEMGNHLFQPVLDDYINGKEVEKKQLYQLWRDHTCCLLNGSDNTGMIRLLAAIRNQNQHAEHKIRVVAGDPNIDWTQIDCLQKYYKHLGSRDEFYSEVVQKFIVEESKKGLIIMGNSHFNKQRTASMQEKGLQNPITELLQQKQVKLYLLNILSSSSFPNDKLKNVDQGSVITTDDSWLGELNAGSPFIKAYPLKDQTDGIIYLGSKSDLTAEKTTPFNDNDYENELERRNSLKKCNE